MAYIQVDVEQISNTINMLEERYNAIQQQHSKIVSYISELSKVWDGTDAEEYEKRVEEVINGKAYKNITHIVKNEIDILKNIKNEYKWAQNTAITRSKTL